MLISRVTYTKNLRCESLHLKSGSKILTDAPTDNKGKGEAFSPTDLAATSLANCMITIMGILIQEKDLAVSEIKADVHKHMAAEPRRISKIEVFLNIKGENLSEKDKKMLENAAKNCPVALSLHPEVIQAVNFSFS